MQRKNIHNATNKYMKHMNQYMKTVQAEHNYNQLNRKYLFRKH